MEIRVGFDGLISRVEKNETEDGGNPGKLQVCGDDCTCNCADCSGDFEKHSDADVGEAFAHVGGCGAGGSGDDGDERSADGVADVYTECEGEEGDDNYAASEAGEGTEEASDERADEEEAG